jgi:hypothetical protein
MGWYAKVRGQKYASGTCSATIKVPPIELDGIFKLKEEVLSPTPSTNGEVRGSIGQVGATLDTDSSCNSKESQADGFLAAISGTDTTGCLARRCRGGEGEATATTE